MRYIKELDSLRAVAIFTVVIVHWFPKDTFFYKVCHAFLAPNIFFTLSGFLITAILLKEEARLQNGQTSVKTVIKQFFLKRVLRIFPLYYAVILFAFLTKPDGQGVNYLYFVGFTSNLYLHKLHFWPSLSHLWSLAVEEQFYLLWPFIILFSKEKYLLPLILTLIFTGLLSQLLVGVAEFDYILTSNCFDAIGLGALLAWFSLRQTSHHFKVFYKACSIIAPVSLILFVVQHFTSRVLLLNNQTYVSIMTVWLIAFFCIREENNSYLFSKILHSQTMIHFGKMSYSIYLFHFLIPYYTYSAFDWLNRFLQLPPYIRDNHYTWIMENFILLILMAMFSYRFIESPVNRVKAAVK